MNYNRRRSNIDDELLKAIQRDKDDRSLLYIFQMPIDRRLLAVVIGLFVLLLIILGGLIMFLRPPGDHSTLADVLSPTPFVRPTRTPTPPGVTPTAIPQPSPPTTGIAIGKTVEVFDSKDGLNIRENPSIDAKIVGRVSDGTRLKVLEGPKDQNGYIWWRIEGTGVSGWCVQNFLRPVQ